MVSARWYADNGPALSAGLGPRDGSRSGRGLYWRIMSTPALARPLAPAALSFAAEAVRACATALARAGLQRTPAHS